MGDMTSGGEDDWGDIARRSYSLMLEFVRPWTENTPQAELDEAVEVGGGVGVLAVAYTTNRNFRDEVTAGREGPVTLPTERIPADTDAEHIVYAAWIAANALWREVVYEVPPTEPMTITPGTTPADENDRYIAAAGRPPQ